MRTFQDKTLAELTASDLSETGNCFAVIQQREDHFVIVEDRNPDLLDGDEILISVYQNGDRLDWSEVYQ